MLKESVTIAAAGTVAMTHFKRAIDYDIILKMTNHSSVENLVPVP